MPRRERRSQNVFLNVPYEDEYSEIFSATVSCLSGLGFKPHCGLETQSTGRDRLRGIFDLISSCGASIHDLSQMGLSGVFQVPRFNMPFELGIAYALQQTTEGELTHRIFIFDREERRFGAALSDMAGFDPKIHRGTPDGVLAAVLNCFSPESGDPDRQGLKDLMRSVWEVVLRIQKEQGDKNLFQLHVFRQIVNAATRLAKERKLIH